MRIGYYPGCSLGATSREYDESMRAVAGALAVELAELPDWSCCGASSAHAGSRLLALALPARNLALAAEAGHAAVLAPCAACFNRLAAARHALRQDAGFAARLPELLGRPLASAPGGVAVRNVVDVLRELAPAIRERATRPLAGLRAACYYGCLLVRPAEICGGEDPEDPQGMEEVVRAAGAEPVAWNLRTECCGGAFSLSRTASVIRLGRAILQDARRAGAEVLVTACPMCHSNLDFRQAAMTGRGEQPLPVLFLTELVGLALGIAPDALGLGRHFVSAGRVAAAAAAAPAPPPAVAAAAPTEVAR